MSEVMEFLIASFTKLFDVFLSSGGLVGVAIICIPLFIRIVRSLRSIISK